jgi:dethiobiotin synthetase
MTNPAPPGLFITGTDTDVGKTYVAAMIARQLAAEGLRVGVYKPTASGCTEENGVLVSEDARVLWEAAGRPGDLEHVCPQRFRAPVAPNLAAEAEGRTLDGELLRSGIEYWRERSDLVIVEGAGGLMCPLGAEIYVADLVYDFNYPLIIVARNALGTINHTLQTLITSAAFCEGLPVAGIVLNHTSAEIDPSVATNRRELELRANPPVLAEVGWQAERFDTRVDWQAIARKGE